MKTGRWFISLVVLVVPLLVSCATKKVDQRTQEQEQQIIGLRTGQDLIQGR